MNLQQYYLLHGDAGLAALAEACPLKPKVSYLRQLIYQPTVKEPSLTMAVQLVKASGGALTFDKLCRGGSLDHRVIRRSTRVTSKPAAMAVAA